SQVRGRFDQLQLMDRLERRNSLSVEFPEIGLGPLFPFGVELIDVRDNTRDYGLTKDALIVTQSYRPTTRFVVQLGGSVELNDAEIFGLTKDATVAQYLQDNPAAAARLRVADGKTYALAERTSVTWDRRDNPFDATSGTFVFAGLEHVRAAPRDDVTKLTSDFLRYSARVAGYVRLTKKGLALALSLRGGYNQQLVSGSETYPDRLFYFGGADTIRGFVQDSVIPQDLAEQIFDEQSRIGKAGSGITADNALSPARVPIRGGNVLVNPRAEFRIPLTGVFQTTLFLDSGNLWVDPALVDLTKLRYAAGSGIRVTTPVGPLALDFGFNLARRYWEDPYAIHFSVGLF
ncbi:MAG TPA: BamA/TamA family outer membrane protein, partial [Polyangiaceae bacterium]|nr:BamA/TamA family outer membrane protein [Polyangiaceae bacterium]